MIKHIFSTVICAVLLSGAGHAQIGGNLTKFPPVELRLDISSAPDGKPVLTPRRFDLITGDYYRLTISSDGIAKDANGKTLARRLEVSEFLSNVHLRLVTVDHVELHLQGLGFRAIELDEAGEVSFTFVPIRTGQFPLYVGPDPYFAQGQPGDVGVIDHPNTAFGVISVE